MQKRNKNNEIIKIIHIRYRIISTYSNSCDIDDVEGKFWNWRVRWKILKNYYTKTKNRNTCWLIDFRKNIRRKIRNWNNSN